MAMSDGGDGFGEVLSELLNASPQRIKTVDAAHRPCSATWWWEANTRTAIVESANVIGLAMLRAGKHHPFDLDTFGLGAILRATRRKGAREILIGIGGSATNDGGFGVARALGWKFLDRRGQTIRQWERLDELAEIRRSKFRRFGKVIVAADVRNPLLGARGATRVYGPQKGLRPGDFAHAERCLRRVAHVVKREFGRDFARVPGAGAAGGLGFGLLAFVGAQLKPGFELFAKRAGLASRLRAADLVVTGEGRIDRSTAMGKGAGEIARRCRELEISCIGLAGEVVRSREVNRLFSQLHALTDLTTPTEARAKPAAWLSRLAWQAASAKA
jgi:glycerate kinase